MAELSTLRKFEALSPFEIKNELRSLAKEATKRTQSAFLMPAAATRTGSPPRHAKASSCSASSRSSKASG